MQVLSLPQKLTDYKTLNNLNNSWRPNQCRESMILHILILAYFAVNIFVAGKDFQLCHDEKASNWYIFGTVMMHFAFGTIILLALTFIIFYQWLFNKQDGWMRFAYHLCKGTYRRLAADEEKYSLRINQIERFGTVTQNRQFKILQRIYKTTH